jgi:hypothetical protein
MRSGSKYILALLLIMPTLSLAETDSNMGNGMKELIVQAIKEGKASGYMDSSISAMFAKQTKSHEPIRIDIERLRQFDDRCVELGVVTHQAGVRDDKGKPGFYRMQFKLPICIDGSYPEFLKAEEEERKKASLKNCRQAVVKGASRDGFVNGSIEFQGCPSNGVVGIFYDGTCKELGPGPDAPVKEFRFDKQGALSIKTVSVNKWQLYIFEKQNAMMPKQLEGIKSVFW